MKKIKKFFILFTMLIASLSFKGGNTTNKMVVADAAEPLPNSYAYLNNNLDYWLSKQGFDTFNSFKNILITDDESKVKDGYLDGCPVDVGRKNDGYTPIYTPEAYFTNGCAIAAYIYKNEKDTTLYDCIFYANVKTMYAYDGSELFARLRSVETITFDCNFSMSKSKTMIDMFASCPELTRIDVSGIDTSEVTIMDGIFGFCRNLTTIIGLEKWNTSNVTDMSSMFSNSVKLKEINVSHFDTSKVTSFHSMFGWCNSLTTIVGLDKFNTSNGTDMHAMFYGCSNLTTIDVSHFDTTNVTNMSNMLGGTGITAISLDNFNTSNVTNMSGMFNNCKNLEVVDLSEFDTSNVTDFSWMFGNCDSLTTLDLSNFDLQSVNDDAQLEYFLNIWNTDQLIEIKLPNNMNGRTIDVPGGFYADVVDSSMQGMSIVRGSEKLNDLVRTLRSLKTCEDYLQGPALQAIYDKLYKTDKETFAKLTDNEGVLLTEKLAYMVYYADYKTNNPTSATTLMISPRTSQYLVVVIACLSLALIGGYYFIQKKKYAK